MTSGLFTNGGFEDGTNNNAPPSWTLATFLNPGVSLQTPQTRAGLNLTNGGTALTKTLVTAGGAESQPDANLGSSASLRWPKFGNAVAIVNQNGKDNNVNSLRQTMTVDAGDVDSVDGLAHIRFAVAPVLQDPGHPSDEQPYFFVQLTNVTKGNAILYQDFNFANQPGVPWKQSSNGSIRYTDWALVDIAPGSARLAPGDQVQLEVIAAGCSQGGHWGYLYVDGVGPTVPGLFVSGVGPAAANQNTDITYTLTYKNGGAAGAGGVAVAFNTPPDTTFVSANAPGLSCTTPAIGGAGLVTCSVGTLAQGSSGSFQVTVHIANGTVNKTITAGNYSISGNGISPLLGPKIYTQVTNNITYANLGVAMTGGSPTVAAGGTVTYTIEVTNAGPNAVAGAKVTDNFPAQLKGITWTCMPSGAGAACTASGTGNINDSATNIPVGGKLVYTVTATVDAAAAAGQLANVASVSVPASASDPDPANNSVGDYKQITVANGVTCTAGTECTSAVCDAADHLCGYPNSSGPCTVANGPVVCRSGACSSNGTCMPAGGCNVDTDCAAGSWCSVSTHTCTAKLPNGTAIPNDPPHTTPTLDGNCSAAAAALTCTSGVCDDGDDACGYANGTGPCTAVNAGVVCRSGACSVAGTCMPTSGCNADGDCATGNWCNISTHACTAKTPNGGAVPTDPAHTTPTLDGTCTADAGALTCVSGVCDDSDDKCGFADGNGSCDGSTAPTVCRSGACSKDGTCMSVGGCNTDGDCTGGKWCNISSHTCTAKVANGDSIPKDAGHTDPTLDGNCTTAAGTLVCASGVCDAADDKCGYPNGKGPCTAANAAVVCRSGSCSSTGVCKGATVCNTDSDCKTTEYCDTGKHACTAKLDNGSPIPNVTGHTPAIDGKCSKQIAAIVCRSSVCDATDDKCGLPNGTGPCSAENAATICRTGVCDPNDGKCGLDDGNGPCSSDGLCRSNRCNRAKRVCGPGCTTDSDCAATEYCKSDGTCSLKQPDGDQCAGANQCQSGACNDQVCDSVLVEGAGIGCAVQPGNGSRASTGAAAFGLSLAIAGFVRRRRRRATPNAVR